MKDPSEHSETAAVVDWCHRQGVLVMGVPNGADVPPKERARLLAEGLEPGAPDLIIRTPPPALPGVYMVAVEMKKRHGGRLSPAQKVWHTSVANMPWWRVVVAHGARDAVDQLRAMGYERKVLDGNVNGC